MLDDCFVGVLDDMGFPQALSPRLRSIWEKSAHSPFLISSRTFRSPPPLPLHTAGRKGVKLGCEKSLCKRSGNVKTKPKYHLSARIVGKIVFAAH